MTKAELQAIREREHTRLPLPGKNGYTDEWIVNAAKDRKRLLDEVDRLQALATLSVTAIKAGLHDLETTSGLYATDGFEAYGNAQREGCDPNGAWDRFVEQTFKLEHRSELMLRQALAAYGAQEMTQKASSESDSALVTRDAVIAWAQAHGYPTIVAMAAVPGVAEAMNERRFWDAMELLKKGKVKRG